MTTPKLKRIYKVVKKVPHLKVIKNYAPKVRPRSLKKETLWSLMWIVIISTLQYQFCWELWGERFCSGFESSSSDLWILLEFITSEPESSSFVICFLSKAGVISYSELTSSVPKSLILRYTIYFLIFRWLVVIIDSYFFLIIFFCCVLSSSTLWLFP